MSNEKQSCSYDPDPYLATFSIAKKMEMSSQEIDDVIASEIPENTKKSKKSCWQTFLCWLNTEREQKYKYDPQHQSQKEHFSGFFLLFALPCGCGHGCGQRKRRGVHQEDGTTTKNPPPNPLEWSQTWTQMWNQRRLFPRLNPAGRNRRDKENKEPWRNLKGPKISKIIKWWYSQTKNWTKLFRQSALLLAFSLIPRDQLKWEKWEWFIIRFWSGFRRKEIFSESCSAIQKSDFRIHCLSWEYSVEHSRLQRFWKKVFSSSCALVHSPPRESHFLKHIFRIFFISTTQSHLDHPVIVWRPSSKKPLPPPQAALPASSQLSCCQWTNDEEDFYVEQPLPQLQLNQPPFSTKLWVKKVILVDQGIQGFKWCWSGGIVLLFLTQV